MSAIACGCKTCFKNPHRGESDYLRRRKKKHQIQNFGSLSNSIVNQFVKAKQQKLEPLMGGSKGT